MLPNTYDIVFNALKWAAIIGIIIFYVNPEIYGNHINTVLCIYILLWFFVLISYYFFNNKSNAVVEGLWVLTPKNANKSEIYDFKTQKMVPKTNLIDLLTENDSSQFLKETFTFGFFLTIDKSSIELINGNSLKKEYKPFQLIVSVPGVYDIYVDPLHEILSIEFYSYNASNYKVNLPTLKNQKWHQILISIEGRTADIYQNGMLLKSVALKNVISSRPGKPKVNMNPDLYGRVAFIQSWPSRLKEVDIINNYRINTDVQGVPRLPVPITSIPGIPELSLAGINFCVGSYCFDSFASETDALSYVNYEYA